MRSILTVILISTSLALSAQDNNTISIHFDFDRSQITAEAKKLLDSVFKTRGNLQNEKLEIHGHCDHIGSDQYNDALSGRRVNAVVKFLLGKYIKQQNILLSKGHGERQPLNDNK